MKGERGEVKRSSVTVKYSQVFPQFKVPSSPIGRAVHWVSANVEIRFICVYVFLGARVLCAFRHACFAPCISVCARMIHMDIGPGHMCSSCFMVDRLTCQSLQQQRAFGFNRFTVCRPSQMRKQAGPRPAAAGFY